MVWTVRSNPEGPYKAFFAGRNILNSLEIDPGAGLTTIYFQRDLFQTSLCLTRSIYNDHFGA